MADFDEDNIYGAGFAAGADGGDQPGAGGGDVFGDGGKWLAPLDPDVEAKRNEIVELENQI